MNATDYKLMVRKSSKRIEKELIKTNNLLNEIKHLNDMLSNIYSQILSLEELTEENPVALTQFRQALKEQKLLNLYKKMEINLENLKKSLNKFEEQSMKSNAFMENFRNCRNYFFNNSTNALEFIEAIFPLFSISNVSYKPEFIGTIDLDQIAKSNGLSRNATDSILLPSNKLKEFMHYLQKNNLARKSKFETELIRVIWKDSNTVSVEADNAKIKRLDRLSKSMDGNYSEE